MKHIRPVFLFSVSLFVHAQQALVSSGGDVEEPHK